MGKKTYLLKNKKLNRFTFSFPFVSNLKQVPPLAQGDGCNNTSPSHIQHNKPRATMRWTNNNTNNRGVNSNGAYLVVGSIQ
jgi:hypothetical protein